MPIIFQSNLAAIYVDRFQSVYLLPHLIEFRDAFDFLLCMVWEIG